MRDRDELDQLIDSALVTYAEPRPGLEKRVHAGISAEAKVSWRRWLLPGLTLPLAASLLLFAYFVPSRSRPLHQQIAVSPTAASTPSVAGVPITIRKSPSISRAKEHYSERFGVRVRTDATQRPKLDIFPAQQPLSEAEQAVTRFAREASEAQRKALVLPEQDLTQPIQITAIHIPPLPSSEDDTH